MANINTANSRPSAVVVPPNFPMGPQPGKISMLFDANKDDIYHKFNARNYDDGNIWFGSNQPYIYRYPDEPPSGLRTFGNRTLPIGAGITDLERMSKFLFSGRGVLFVAKQFLLQGNQPFDETNLYNPTEVLLSTAARMTGGILYAPKRHIDKSGGLLGGLASLVGVSVSRGLPPASTVASSGKGSFLTGAGGSGREEEVLPVQNYGNATGLLRAKTALKARGILQSKWGAEQTTGRGGGILGMVKNFAKSIVPQLFRADSQAGIDQRADERAYDWMVRYYNNYTAKNMSIGTKKTGIGINFLGISFKKLKSTYTSVSEITNSEVGLFEQKYYHKTEDGSFIYYPSGSYYEERSEMRDRYKVMVSEPTQNNPVLQQINDNLKKILDEINSSKEYNTLVTNKDTWLVQSGDPTKYGYDRIYDIAKTSEPYEGIKGDYPNSVRQKYVDSNTRTLDASMNPYKNYGFSGAGRPDRLNTLTILDESGNIPKEDQVISNYTKWDAYNDDIIAFFFYDVVNKKHIPFRSTITALSENNNALWDPIRFVGRADEIYSYTGFNRTLSFSFKVVVNSIVELIPIWKRINYLVGSVKPSRYTEKVHSDNYTNKFITPPMFQLTIGDLFVSQPIIINAVNVTIPENAAWETMPSKNYYEEVWSYLGGTITSPTAKYGQYPREVDIQVSCNIMEKKVPVIGGDHYISTPVG